jgi:UDP-N-acetylglucosamine acyltransferase
VVQDVPPFCAVYKAREVAALNIVGLRRAGYRDHIPGLQDAFRILYMGRHTVPNALSLIEEKLGHDELCRELVSFIRSSKRGITPYGSSGCEDAPVE